uniref:Shisa family member 6 n=1 Tax=Scleropages formosus TaxID=113540 RepID=A0A8C9QZF2_SCLFO
MGIQHLLLLFIYVDPLNIFCAAMGKKSKNVPKRNQRVKEVNSTAAPTSLTQRATQVQPPLAGSHDTCLGYYDVSGQYDKEFECNNTDHRYCCGSCFLRFCCQFKGNRLDQKTCTNYNTPDWIKTQPPSPVPTGETYDPNLDRTNTTVYITCGVIAFIIILGVSAKVAYDKATKPPQEMNCVVLYLTGYCFISVTYLLTDCCSVSSITTPTEKPRMNNILTSQTEPYDLSFSRSFQNLAQLPSSFDLGVKSDLNICDRDLDDYYRRNRHIPELPPRGTMPLHFDQSIAPQRQRPHRVQRAMSQDHVLSPERAPPLNYGLSSYIQSSYSGRILSEEQLLSAEHLHSQDPLLSPEKMLTLRHHGHRQKISRAMSHADMLLPTSPMMERHKISKTHLHPSASIDAYNTLSVNHTTSKRQAFASRRMHTVDHLQYIPGHPHYHTSSKSEVTV